MKKEQDKDPNSTLGLSKIMMIVTLALTVIVLTGFIMSKIRSGEWNKPHTTGTVTRAMTKFIPAIASHWSPEETINPEKERFEGDLITAHYYYIAVNGNYDQPVLCYPGKPTKLGDGIERISICLAPGQDVLESSFAFTKRPR